MAPTSSYVYPPVSQSQSFPELEKEILARWEEQRTFERSVEQHPRGGNEFVFYDGPPFANGLPHAAHLLTGYVKDIIPRYQTMRGKRVERRFGWDCHGLPAEMNAEKITGVSGRAAITAFGIDKFNQVCRDSVLKYTSEWRAYVTRMGRWVDFDNDYKTMDMPYTESVLWAFKQLWEKGLVYEGLRVMPYSWACETPLSNFEIRLDDATRPRQDPALTVGFSLENGDKLLAWTTTPWTLPSNLMLAVNPDIEYVRVKRDGAVYVLAQAALAARYAPELGTAEVLEVIKGAQLVGLRYQPLLPYFKDHPGAFKVISAEFVSTEDGTGVVHLAPGFGEEDFKACQAAGVAPVVPVDQSGKFTAPIPAPYVGVQVHEAQKQLIRDLKELGVVLRHETIEHNYPHCWRTDTPIIYRAMSSWYVRVTELKARMLELNQQINWIPSHIQQGQFGKWLENARDWSISRSRFFGAPIPIWKSDNPAYPRIDVYGSLAELERDFGVRPKSFHRPDIDQLVRPNPDDPTGKSMMRRVEDVFDCWFESGSMPFAQVHYPFENKEWFEQHFPADFIVEYIGQTRGWFYTLLILATALFDKPPFRNCICHGVLLDGKGQKFSKKLKNYRDPQEILATIGSDALRWYFLASPIFRGQDLFMDQEGKGVVEVVRTVINPLWNALYFFTLYANAEQMQGHLISDSPSVLDQYILSKTKTLVLQIQSALDRFELAEAGPALTSFLESLNNWYIRRSRERFWRTERDADKQAAYDTLYTVLVTVAKAVAPLLPFLAEKIFTTLTNKESVHLEAWPDVSQLPSLASVEAAMDEVRAICSCALFLRETAGLRTRLPLHKVTIAGEVPSGVAQFAELIKDEINVKHVEFDANFAQYATRVVQVNAKELGPKLGTKMKDVLAATRSGAWQVTSGGELQIAGVTLPPADFVMKINAKNPKESAALPSNRAVVVLDTVVTEELKAEGTARDLVRAIQQARKDAGFHVADRIVVDVEATAALQRSIVQFKDYIAEQVLAQELRLQAPQTTFKQSAIVEDQDVVIGVQRV